MNNPIIGITTDIEGEYLKIKHYYCDAILEAGGIPILIPPIGSPDHYAEIINGLLIPEGMILTRLITMRRCCRRLNLFREGGVILRFLC